MTGRSPSAPVPSAPQLDDIGQEGFLPDNIWAPERSKITRELDG